MNGSNPTQAAVRAMTEIVAISATCQQVFDALITPSAISTWWQANRAIVFPEQNGIWVASWGDDIDDPDYLTAARMTQFDPPNRIVMSDYNYRSKFGELPFQASFVTTFDITATDEGCTLRVSQSGFPLDPVADNFYRGCCIGWQTSLKQLRDFVLDAKNQL